ncbi:MAG: hypothetical protein QOI36_733 [Pseudonocardiales bacterium]|nr:hypothetical protein [Pseudonocardiales bacterium]
MKLMLLTYGIPATGANIDGTEDTLLAEIMETGSGWTGHHWPIRR